MRELGLHEILQDPGFSDHGGIIGMNEAEKMAAWDKAPGR
jgi:hypothetical protein